MFEHLSLQRSDTRAISTEVQMAQKGFASRIVFGLVMAACSLMWLPAPAVAAYAAAFLAWELALRPWSTARAVSAWRNDRPKLRLYQRCMIFAGACLYTFVPATGVLSSELIGWYVATMAFCSAVIAGVTYFSNDKWQFAVCIGPSFVVANAAPFLFHVAPATAFVVCILNVMFTLSALRSALHRAQLVESISTQDVARARAELASVEKSRFIANVSHELRTPLNAIIGYSELMRESAQDEARNDDAEDLDKVLAASRRLLTMVNELLDISKIEAGKLALNLSWFHAPDMIDEALAAAAPAIAAAGATIRADADPALGRGVSDEFRLCQCLVNLLTSAARLAPGRALSFAARRERRQMSDWFEFEISGLGPAPTEALELLFDPFAQMETTARAQAGSGLSLAITRRVARLLGGDVWAEERDGGAVLVLRAPAQANSVADALESSAA